MLFPVLLLVLLAGSHCLIKPLKPVEKGADGRLTEKSLDQMAANMAHEHIEAMSQQYGDPRGVVEHKCIHDQMLEHGDHESEPAFQPLVREVEGYGPDATISDGTSRKRQNPSGTGPLRLLINTKSIDPVARLDPYACYQVGQQITVGGTLTRAGTPYTCRSSDVITPQKFEWLSNLLVAAELKLNTSMKVEQVAHLNVTVAHCGFNEKIDVATIAPELLTGQSGGKGYDVVIFVTGRPILQENVLAFGGECQHDSRTFRATAGQLNYSPSSLSVDEKFRSQLGTTLHEIVHILGFSSSKWDEFRGPGSVAPFGDGVRRPETDVLVSQTWGGKILSVVKTLDVQDFVEQHFACPGLAGAAIEDGGSTGTAGSHWEKRIFMNEFMTGSSSNDPIFSLLTLRMFKDSGWYTDIVAAEADQLVWGYGLGCDFVEEKCSSGWPKETVYPGYYCTEAQKSSCSFDLKGKAVCGITEWDPAPPQGERYFGATSRKGGLSQLADYCPSYSTYEYCIDEGADYRCFESSLTDIAFIGEATSSTKCLQMKCSSNTTIKVEVTSGDWFDCNGNNDEISAGGTIGSIKCPKNNVIASICGNAIIEANWPSVFEIKPTRGTPGSEVTVIGSGFTAGTTCDIHGPVTNLTVVDGNTIKCKIPDGDHFRSPSHLLDEKVDVACKNPDGRSGVLPEGFTIHVEFNLDFVSNMVDWLADNTLYAAIGGGALVLGLLCCIYCCCSGSNDDEYVPQRSADGYRYRR